MEGIELIEEHPKTIIHIDMDYYYAQVEEVLDPTLKDKPFGIKQRFHVVTANYIARDYGIKKMTMVNEALKLCPSLILVNGEDLTKYKQMSARIFEVLNKFTPNVEKLGLDENYLDVTSIISERLENNLNNIKNIEGCIYPDASDVEAFNSCICGCDKRLILGTHLAKEIRDSLYNELGMKSCAGIAHNKFLAKIVGSMNKPNNQTVLIPGCSTTFLANLDSLRSLTGIGEKTAFLLEEIGIKTVLQLQECSLDKLKKKFGYETACKIKDLSYGRDESAVRPSGKPKSVGLEDSCPPISIKADAEEKFRHLLVRLVKNITDDGRIPIAIKVTVRKVDSVKKTSHRESRQDKILPSLFRIANGKIVLVDGAHVKILAIVMKLFERIVDLRQPYNITLLGLSFFKFQERRIGSKSIANFLIKKSDVEVQSITNLSNENITLSDSIISNKSTAMDYEPEMSSDMSIASLSGSESDIEPSPKKSRRLETIIAKRGLFPTEDEASPSKLRVADLRLNSKEFDIEPPPVPPSKLIATFASKLNNNVDTTSMPSNVDPNVFKELPIEMQNELLSTWRTPTTIHQSSTPISISSSSTATSSTTNKNTLHRYFVKNT